MGIKPIEQAILQTIEAIEKENININLKEAKQTSGGYLTNISFQAFGQTTEILLQFSLRKSDKKGEVITVAGDFIPPYVVVNLPQELLVDEKIQALLSRKKPRDFYDLYFILRSNLLPAAKKDILPTILKTVQQIDINFEMELRQFLPKSHWLIIKDFKQTLEQEINRFI